MQKVKDVMPPDTHPNNSHTHTPDSPYTDCQRQPAHTQYHTQTHTSQISLENSKCEWPPAGGVLQPCRVAAAESDSLTLQRCSAGAHKPDFRCAVAYAQSDWANLYIHT